MRQTMLSFSVWHCLAHSVLCVSHSVLSHLCLLLLCVCTSTGGGCTHLKEAKAKRWWWWCCNRICRRFVSYCDYVNGNGCSEHMMIDARRAHNCASCLQHSNRNSITVECWYSILQIAKCTTIAPFRIERKKASVTSFSTHLRSPKAEPR